MKFYVIVREDLIGAQKAVQGAHGVAEYLLKFPNTTWDNGTMVLLKVKNEDRLKHWVKKLELHDIEHIGWREEDLQNSLTSVAAVGSNAGELFKNLRLL